MIKTKLDAMQAAMDALEKIDGGSSGLYGMFDAEGNPTGEDGGSVETLLVSVIDQSFNGEETAADAMQNVRKWLRDMAHEILAVADLLPCGEEEDDA